MYTVFNAATLFLLILIWCRAQRYKEAKRLWASIARQIVEFVEHLNILPNEIANMGLCKSPLNSSTRVVFEIEVNQKRRDAIGSSLLNQIVGPAAIDKQVFM